MNIGQSLKNLRKQKNLTQKELASILKIGQASICEWEQNKYEPTLSAIIVLSKFFNCTIEELIGLSNLENTSNLTKKEQRLLKSFNQLDTDEQNKIIEDCEYFANKHTKVKKERA